MAHKNARILWAVMSREQAFDPAHVSQKPQAKCPKSPPGSAATAAARPALACAA